MRVRSGWDMRPALIAISCIAACSYPALQRVPDASDAAIDAPATIDGADALVFLQRARRNDTGDIFQYVSYVPGARLVKLSPPTANGTLTTLCCDAAGPDFANIDIGSYDLSFDARSIVFSGKLAADQLYGLFMLSLDTGQVEQLASDPQHDYIAPIFVPGNRIVFMTNAVAEPGAPQFQDEYERSITTQLGRVNTDGTNVQLGPRHLSHRTAPSLASDGRVIFTQWDHLGPNNAGNLMFVDQDMETLHEAFGKEGTGASNSTLKPREISPGRFVAIATARSRTLNAGALIDIRLGTVQTDGETVSAPTNQSEANATSHVLTPDVPLGTDPSTATVGRYYDAFPLDATDKPRLIASWADGPVEASTLAAAGATADFGIYLYDSARGQRQLIFNDPARWDIFAQPLRARPVPSIVGAGQNAALGGKTLIGSLDAYTSTLHTFAPSSIVGIRVLEGYSSEEGFPASFGTPNFEGQASLGIAPVAVDGSWSATIPANIPVHLQAVDKFGMSLFSEPEWFSGRAGEQIICGGCHEDRAKPPAITPAQITALLNTAVPLLATTARANRLNTAPTSAQNVVGVGWDKMLQPIFNARCVGCHGPDNKAGIAPFTITNPATGQSVNWTFDLSGTALPTTGLIAVAAGNGAYSSSYFSLIGPDLEAVETGNLMISGNFKAYVAPGDAPGSLLIKLLNPVQQLPAADTTVRAFSTVPHLVSVGATDLTPLEYYELIQMIDAGGSFFARENKP